MDMRAQSASFRKGSFPMSIKTRIAAVAVAAIAVTGSVAATTQQAQAHPHGLGLGLGIGLATAAVVGTVAAASQPGYGYPAYPEHRCWWQPQYNVFGQYIGTIRTCNYY